MNSPPQIRRTQPGKGWVRDRTSNNSGSNFSTTVGPAQQIIARLEGVIKTAQGWRAHCPAHGGKSASLAVTEADNGTLLLHCFAGCQVHDVLAAVGLEVSDLFVRKDLRSMSTAERSQLRHAAMLPRWRAALNVLVTEASVVLIGACQLGDGQLLDDTDLNRLRVAALRIFDAQAVLHER
ncbi:MAG: hypothetical protein ABI858_08810 [Pseudoxanthomonas sp.]